MTEKEYIKKIITNAIKQYKAELANDENSSLDKQYLAGKLVAYSEMESLFELLEGK